MVHTDAFIFALATSATTAPATATAFFTVTRRGCLVGLCRIDARQLRFRLRVFVHIGCNGFALVQRLDGGFLLRLLALTALRPFATLLAFRGFRTLRALDATFLTPLDAFATFAALARFTGFARLTGLTRFAEFTRFPSLARLAAFTRFASFTSPACVTRFAFLATAALTATRAAGCTVRGRRRAIARRSTATAIAIAIAARTLAALRAFTAFARGPCRRRRFDGRGRRLHFRLHAEQVFQPADESARGRCHGNRRRLQLRPAPA